MSIRTRLFALLGLLGLALLVACGLGLFASLTRLQTIEHAADVNALTDLLLEAASAQAVERGTVNGLLANPTSLKASQHETIAYSRKQGDAALDEALGRAVVAGNGPLQDAAEQLKAARSRLTTFRERADRVLKGIPDATLRQTWFAGVTEVIMRGQDFAIAARGTLEGDLPATVLRGLHVKQSLWEAAEYAGRERGAMNGLIAASVKLSTEQLQTMAVLRGRVESAFGAALAESGQMSGSLRAALAAAQTSSDAFNVTRVAAYRAGAEGAPYPIDATTWFAQATAAITPFQTAQRIATGDIAEQMTTAGATARRMLWMAFSGALIALTLVAVGATILLRRVTGPLAKMTSAMHRLAQGDLTVTVPGLSRSDEIGSMAAAVQVFRDGLIRMEALEEETAQARLAAEEQRKAIMRQMADGFERAVGGIVGMVSASATELQATAATMTATAGETAAQSTTVAAAAEQAASNVATVAAASEELGGSVQEIARQVQGSASLAQAAVGEADQTARLVGELTAAVSKIGDVVTMISSIASQTNLLALNATIEAARAGDAGKGFAVVAAEVKELASQTARATDEIGGHIGRIQCVTGQAVTAIGSITGRIREINTVAATIAAAVEQQGAATQEIVRNVAQAATGTGEVTANIAGVAQASEDTGAAATQVLSSSGELSRHAEQLTAEMNRFLATVRAA